jgi:hypothetical protein
MQTLSSQHPNNLNPQTRKIAVIAILLFALSGLVSGFAVGAFGHTKAKTGTGTAPDTGTRTTPVVRVTQTPVSTTTTEHVNLDLPVIGDYSYFQIANGSTNYTFSALIINKNNNPIQVSDVTCKLWLTKEGDVNSILRAGNYAIPRTIDNIQQQQPFPKEVVGAFNYIAPSQQIQPCAPTGKTTWNYTISQSVDPGTYNLVVLADWKGNSFNWRWVSIVIKKAG